MVGGGGVKGQKVQVVMRDEVLELRFNKSHRASANQPAAVGRGTKKKKFYGLRYDPPERCQVRVGLRALVGTQGVGLCMCVWPVSMSTGGGGWGAE